MQVTGSPPMRLSLRRIQDAFESIEHVYIYIESTEWRERPWGHTRILPTFTGKTDAHTHAQQRKLPVCHPRLGRTVVRRHRRRHRLVAALVRVAAVVLRPPVPALCRALARGLTLRLRAGFVAEEMRPTSGTCFTAALQPCHFTSKHPFSPLVELIECRL